MHWTHQACQTGGGDNRGDRARHRHRHDSSARSGTVVIPVGLAILATEFVWARRLLHALRKRVPGVDAIIRGGNKNDQE